MISTMQDININHCLKTWSQPFKCKFSCFFREMSFAWLCLVAACVFGRMVILAMKLRLCPPRTALPSWGFQEVYENIFNPRIISTKFDKHEITINHLRIINNTYVFICMLEFMNSFFWWRLKGSDFQESNLARFCLFFLRLHGPGWCGVKEALQVWRVFLFFFERRGGLHYFLDSLSYYMQFDYYNIIITTMFTVY